MNKVIFGGGKKDFEVEQGSVLMDTTHGNAGQYGQLYLVARCSETELVIVSLEDGNWYSRAFSEKRLAEELNRYGCFTHLGECNISVSKA